MAGTKALNVRMNFQVDTTQARQQIQQLGAQLNSITKASNFGVNSQFGITQEILQATKAAAQLKTTIAEAINPLTGNLNLTAFNDQLRASGMSLIQYRDQLASLGTVGNQTFNTLARSIATAETPLLRTGKAAQQMWTVLGNTVRWQATSSMIHGIMSTASQAMNYVKSLDNSLNSIRIVTGQSQAQMERFAKTANQAAKELNTSTNAYAQASLIYYQQGLSNKEVEARTATTIKLANVAGESASKVSDQLTAVWNNFYDGSKSLEYYADVMTALGASTASSTDEIAKGLEKFSSIAKTTGLSYEYATSALSTVVAATRQSADSVGTSFKTLFSRLQGLSLGETLEDGTTLNKYSKALDVIGVNIKNANGSLKDMDDILDEIGERWTSLSKAEQVALAQTVGGARNYTGLVSLMDNWDSFQTNLQTAQQAQGALQNQADIYAQSWEAASKHVKAASETIYKNLLNDQFFKGLTNGFGSVLDMVGSLTNSLGGFKGTMLTLGNAAFQLFKPQITEGFANLGLNLRGIVRGQQDIIDIRTQARNALMAPVNFSRYDEVNQIQQQMNQNLNQRQVLYESMQQKGKIPSYLQPAYQTMFNAINAQSDEAIASAERVFGMNEEQQMAQIRAQQSLNYKTNQYNQQLKTEAQYQQYAAAKAAVDKNPKSPMLQVLRGMEQNNPALPQILKDQFNGDTSAMMSAGAAARILYNTHTNAYMNGGMAGITGKAFSDYAEQYRAMGVAANLQGISRGNLSAMTQDDSKRMASYITQMVTGSKQLGINFANTIPELDTINNQIQSYYKELQAGNITQDEYNKKIHETITQHKTLGATIEGLIGPQATKLAEIEGNMLTEAYKAAGITDTESTAAKEIQTNLRNVLTSSEMTEAARLETMRKLGVSDESAKAMLATLNAQNETKNFMNMSSAVATSMNALYAAGQVITSTTNLVKTFGDENATASQQVSALTASAMSIGMAVKPWQDFKAHAGDTLKLFGQETSLTLGKFSGILAGVATAALVASAATKEWNASHNLEKIIDGYTESIAISTQKASEAQSAYENLLTQKETHNKLADELQTLQSGTLEFNNALLQANLNAQNLIDTYDLVYGEDYIYGQNGVPEFNDEQLDKKVKEKQQEAIDASYDTRILSSYKSMLQLYNDNKNVDNLLSSINNKDLDLSFGWASNIGSLLQVFSEIENKDKTFEEFYREKIVDSLGGESTLYQEFKKYEQEEEDKGRQPLSEEQWREAQIQQRLNDDLKAFQQIFPEASFEEINDTFNQMREIIGVNGVLNTNNLTAEQIDALSNLLTTNTYSIQQMTYGQSIIAAALNKNQDLTASQKELIGLMANDVYNSTDFVNLATFMHQMGTDGWFEKTFTGHGIQEVYKALYDKTAEDMEADEIRTAIETRISDLALTNKAELETRLSTVGSSIEKIGLTNIDTDLTKLINNYKNLNLPNLTNLSEEDIEKSYNALMTFDRTLGFVNEKEAKEYATSTGLAYQAAKVNYGGGILSYTDPITGKRIDNSSKVFVSKYSGEILTQDQIDGLLEAGRLNIDAEMQRRPGWLGGLETVYTPEQIQSILDSAEIAENWVDGFEIKTSEDPEQNKIIKKYQDYATQLYNNQRNELAEALYINFSDGLLDGEKLKEKGSPFYDTLSSLAGKFTKETENSIQYVYKSLTYGALKEATNAIINANTVGENVTAELTKQMILGRTRDGSFDSDTLAIMRNYNYENSISAMYANSRLQKNAPDAQRDKYIKLFSAQIEDIDREKGWFQMLYNSSGFSDVLEKIQDQFNTSGQISAEYITKLADKSETLSQFLQVSADSAGLLNVNAGGLASVFEELNKGTINTSDVNSTLMSAMSTGSSRSAANAAAFEVVDNLDLGRSGLDFLDYFQDMAKQMYQSEKAGWGFYTDPIQNIIDLIGGPEVRAAYNEANSHADWNFKQMWDFMSSDSRSSGFMEFMDSMAGKKGKGGGGPADVMSYLYDVLKNTGVELNDDLWNQLGFRVNEKGSFWLREESDRSQNFTQDQLVDNLTKFLVEHGWDEESARSMAQVQMGTASTSGQVGYTLDYRAATQSYDQMLRSNTPMSEQQRRAWFNQYGALLTKPDGTKYKDFEDFDANYTGNKGWAATNKTDWNNITNINDLVAKAREAGTTFVDTDGTIHAVGETSILGEQGQFNQLAQAYNAAIIGSHGEVAGYDYDKLVEMIEAMNGTEADLQRILEENEEDFKGKIYGKNAYGREIKFDGDEFKHLSDFVTELNKPKAQEQMMYNNLTTQGSVDVFQGMQQLYWENPETGEVVLDPYGTKRNEYQQQLETNSAELRERASNAQMNADLVEHYDGTEEQKQEAQKQADTASYAADMYDYQHLMSTEQRQAYLDEARKQFQEDPNKMTPFQKSLLSIVDDINTGVADQLEIAEETENGGATGKGKTKLNEEGELVDEEGNPIELPEGQQPQSGSSGGGDSGGDTGSGGGPGGTKGPSADDRKAAGGAFVQGLLDGKFGNGQDSFTFGGQTYGVVRNDSGVITGYTDSNGVETSIDEAAGTVALASGQNNARLLAYASGKEGHIAITGELGPELRVKSDGSMDVLGKKGREYAWVEPGDRIYTASQSAGILKSNKIPGLEGLAKGINNYIPGYEIGADWNNSGSSGGGSSGGGGRSRGGGGTPTETDPRYDPNTLKIRDVLERYYTILQKIDDITRAVEKFAKVADRAWGEDRIKAIEKQTSLYQQQYDAQKQYVKQIGEYMNTDKNALTTMIREFVEGWNTAVDENPDPNNTMEKISWAGAAFDSNGVLTNYRDFVEKLVEQYNNNAQANAMDKNAQYKFQEQLKDIQMYTDTLNLWESETDKLQELANQILDNSLKEITYRVEYELELNADQKRLLDFQDSFVKDDIFRVAEHIANMNDEIANTADSLEKTRKGLYDYLGTLAGENMRAGEFYDDVALGIATRDEQGLVSAKNYDDIDFKQVSNTVDSWIKKLSKEDAEEVNKIVQRDANGIITNYRDVVNKINEMNKKLSSDSISLLLNDAQQFFDKLSDLTNNPKWTGLSTEMKDQITNYMDQMIQYIQSMGEEFQEIVESMGDSIKAFGKKIDAEIDEFDYYGDVYKSFGNIIDLTNQHMTDITADFFNTLNSKALDNNINKIEVARRRYDLFTKTLGDVQAQYNAMLDRLNNAQGAEEKAFYQQRVDELKEQLDIANSQMENAHKDFLQSWEDALSKIQESYKSAIEQASKDFEKGFSPLFNTLALLQAQFDREKALGDLYVDNYQKIHDLNKLNRDIDQSISDTDNLKSKGRLRDLQKEINDLQEDGTELSEYDLDILDKKYKLELARQALEDARDAKSIVRLSRDNNGNWGYVYTADEDEIAEAEQNYEDAIRDMEEANQNYIDNIQDQILQVQQEAQQAILALQPEDFATYDDYLAAVQNIQNSMYQTLDYLRSQLNNAFGNNDWLETIVPGIVKDHDLTNDFANTPLAQLLVNGNLDSMIDSAKTNLQDNLIKPALESFTIYSEKQKEVYAAAGKDMATIGQTFGKEMDTLTEKSEKQVDVVMKLADRVEDSFGKTMDAVIKATDDWLDKIKDVVKEYDVLLEKITELKKIDGEYVEPAKMINGDNAVDTWEELDRFKRELTSNGTLNLITTDTATGKETATKYVAGTQATLDFLHGVTVAAAKKDIIDLGENTDPFASQFTDIVDDAEDAKVREYLKAHGVVWVKWKDTEGDHEMMFSSIEEWEAWRELHKPKITWSDGGGGGDHHAASNEENYFSWHGWGSGSVTPTTHHGWADTGGYTGRWQSADTGMYTGEWPMGSVRRNGRLAWLHQKELVLNAHDTENFLDAMQVVRQLDNLTNWMANGLGDLIMPKVTGTDNELEQNVHIEAEFPNVTDHNEIEQAFTNLVNMASQYANRK